MTDGLFSPQGVSFEDLFPHMGERGLCLLDLRSPVEYSWGHIPGAVNLPLFEDQERHEIGLCFRNEGQGPATRMGIEMLAAKAPAFMDAAIAAADGAGQIAVHCARGGMRSQSVALWLRSAGLRVAMLVGGYKAYRQVVLRAFDDMAKHEFIVLHGRTGSGKTDLLARFPAGFPLIDIEAIAHHRGSAFGDFAQAEPCPTQQNFENRLAMAYMTVRSAPRILVEIEDRLGDLYVPLPVRDRFYSSSFVIVDRDFDDRKNRLAEEYCRLWTPEMTVLFKERLPLLKRHLRPTEMEALVVAVEGGDFHEATRMLLEWRYDKIYDKQIRRIKPQSIGEFNLTHDEDAAVDFIRNKILVG